MAWVKRNLGLVIGGAVALVLMGVAAYYLWTQLQRDAAVSAELGEKTSRYNELANRGLLPGGTVNGEKVDNIENAKAENKRLEEFLHNKVRAKFGSGEAVQKLSDQEFRALLDVSIADMQKEAERVGVALPQKDYWFTFAPQKSAISFKAVETLTAQLMDVKSIVDILYQARVHDLSGLKRAPATSEDNNGTDFLSDKKAKTNDFTISTPYEVTFQGFSSELAKVMEGLANAERCFVIRSVAVGKAQAADQSGSGTGMPTFPQQMSSSMMMMMRYGMRPMAPPPTAAPAAAPRRPGNVLLDENKLRFVLTLEAVRLKPAGDKKVAQAAQPTEPAAQ